MAPEKATEMVLNVDLKCSGCYKKVKKVICKIPQIRDQVFEVDKNKVKIVVVCCSPEKIRDKLCYKGGGAIQSIEIVETTKPADKPKVADKARPVEKPKEAEKAKPVEKPKEAEKAKPAEKPKEAEKAKPAEKPKEAEKAKPADKPKEAEKAKPKEAEKAKPADKPKEAEKAKSTDKPKEAEKKPEAGLTGEVAKMMYEPVHGYPQMYPPVYPMVGYGQYYEGSIGVPYQHGYGVSAPPPPGYGYGYEYGYGGNRNSNMSGDYFSEENSQGCSIM